MKTKLALISTVLLLLFVNSSNAQSSSNIKKLSFGVGLNIGVGIVSTSYYSDEFPSLGLDLNAEYRLLPQLGVNFNTGLMYFSDSFVDLNDGFGIIPVTLGVNYYFGNIFYAGLKTGLALFAKNKIDPLFTISPIVGVKLLNFLNIALQFQYFTETDLRAYESPNLINLRIGVNF